MHLTTAAVTCFHLSCGMERGWIKEEKYLLQHLVHVVCKQVVESAHCLLRSVSQGCQSGRPMVKLFTKDPQPCALPRTARPLLDGPLDRLPLGTDGALTSLLFNPKALIICLCIQETGTKIIHNVHRASTIFLSDKSSNWLPILFLLNLGKNQHYLKDVGRGLCQQTNR